MPSDFIDRFQSKNQAAGELTSASLDVLYRSLDDQITAIAIQAGLLIIKGWADQKRNHLPLLLDRIKQTLEQPSARLLEKIPDFRPQQMLEEAGLTDDAHTQRQMLKELLK